MKEILPILDSRTDGLHVIGKIDRLAAHTKAPIYHATAVVIALTPTGQIVLADRYAKKVKQQQLRHADLPAKTVLLEAFGGHLKYEDIPQNERKGVLSLETYRQCALRELREELCGVGEAAFVPEESRLYELGFYPFANDHNHEYSWVFVYYLPNNGPFVSMDTITGYDEAYEIDQPIYTYTISEIIQLYETPVEGTVLSDGIGRVLKQAKVDGYQTFKEKLKKP